MGEKTLIILLAIFIILSLLLGGHIVYDKYISNNNLTSPQNEEQSGSNLAKIDAALDLIGLLNFNSDGNSLHPSGNMILNYHGADIILIKSIENNKSNCCL